ncbi:MAG: SDR family oxidoreductase [Patescibacteria group bacterium]|nr:SDR family oxidoreductase [Patescibacteria group bacterium]
MILVTGGNGFIGKHICSRLVKEGKRVVIADKDIKNISNTERNCTYEECNIESRDQISRVFMKYSFTTVVHMAAMLQTASQNNPIESANVNVRGGLYLFEKAYQSGVSRFIFGSSISVYGSQLNVTSHGVNETDPASPEDIYGTGKRYIEIAGEMFGKKFGVSFISLRIGSVVGPGAENTSSKWRSEVFEKLRATKSTTITIPYRSDVAIPLVHVEDVADMIKLLIAIESPEHTIYNAPAETWRLAELAHYIKSIHSNVTIVFGANERKGFPCFINGQRFIDEFRWTGFSLKEHFREVLAKQ